MWTPSQNELQTLVELFQQSVDNGYGKSAQRTQARHQLEAARQQPDLCKYLGYLLTESAYPDSIRATAGLYLKTVLHHEWTNLSPEVISYLKQHIVRGLASPTTLIRNTTSIVVTTLLTLQSIAGWPELLPEIIAAIDNSQPGEPIQDGCLSALKVICEDSAGLVSQNDELLNALVPKLISFCQSGSPRVRANAVACLTEFVPQGAQGFLVHIDSFMQTLFALAQNDSNTDTLSCICRAFSEILTVRPDKLLPYIEGVVQFCAHCTKSDASNTSLDGAEFLLSLAESEIEEEIISPLLPLIVPSVLETMVLSEEDLFVLEGIDEDDSSQADREQDIKPSLPKTKKGHGQNKDEEEDEEDDLEMGLEDWNLRKCSAMTLDCLAMKDAPKVVEVGLPVLLNRIASNQEWPIRESAVLAFGAIAQGVMQAGVTSFVPELVPFLCELLASEHAPIREITCWTLSRYTGQDGLDWPSFQGVLKCTLDVNKRVQATACAALSTLAENAGTELEPYASDLFAHLGSCFSKYQAKNMLSLYECVQTCSMALMNPVSETPSIIVPCLEPMLQRWSQVTEEDQEMLALLESFSFLAVSMGPAFAPYAPTLFERSVILIRDCLVLMERAALDPLNCEYPEPMIVVSSIDMIDGLVQALRDDGMGPLFAAQESSTQTRISEMIITCLSLDDYDIRQSALALLGDLAINCFSTQVAADLPKLMPYLIELLNPDSIQNDLLYEPVGDNTMWAISEIALHTEYSLEPWFGPIFEKLGTILMSKEPLGPSIVGNSATAIGRLALNCTSLIAPHLNTVFSRVVDILGDVEPTLEKDTAIQGLCMAIGANPDGISDEQLLAFLKMLATYFSPSTTLQQLTKTVIGGYQQTRASFNSIVGQLAPAFTQQLALYGLV